MTDAQPPPAPPASPAPSVLAAVVTYFPGEYLGRHLTALRDQVDDLVVIDNGSPGFAAIEQAALPAGCRVIGNGANLGIAAALNQAAQLARDEGYDWLATFDQDSLIPAGAIAGLLDLEAAHPDRQRIGVLAMSHHDRHLDKPHVDRHAILRETADWSEVRVAITSGSLIRVATLEAVGGFDADLFIDQVDHDFCLRCRRHGWLIIQSREQVLEHAIGEAKAAKVLWLTGSLSNHSPERRYYITRNSLEVCRRHLTTDFSWARVELQRLVWNSTATVLLEGQKRAKASAMLHGAWHFAIRRFGPRRRAVGGARDGDNEGAPATPVAKV